VAEGPLGGNPVIAPAPERLSRLRGRLGALRRDQRGTALVEFALVALPLFLIIFGILDFGRALNYYNDMTQLAGQGARFAAVNQEPCTQGQASCGTASANFQQDLAAWADSPELKNKVQVCIVSDPSTTTVGTPVTVKVSYQFKFLPLIRAIPITLSSTQTERSETSTATYVQGGPGC